MEVWEELLAIALLVVEEHEEGVEGCFCVQVVGDVQLQDVVLDLELLGALCGEDCGQTQRDQANAQKHL